MEVTLSECHWRMTYKSIDYFLSQVPMRIFYPEPHTATGDER